MSYSEMSDTEKAETIDHLVAQLIADPVVEPQFGIAADKITNKVNSLLAELIGHIERGSYSGRGGGRGGRQPKPSLSPAAGKLVKTVQEHLTEIITLKRKEVEAVRNSGNSSADANLEDIAEKIQTVISHFINYRKYDDDFIDPPEFDPSEFDGFE